MSRTFVNVHVTVSPAATLIVAVAPAIVVLLVASTQTSVCRVQPASAVSLTTYVPGVRLSNVADCPPVSVNPSASSVAATNANAVASLGELTFWTTILPLPGGGVCLFLNTQCTVSPRQP